MSGEDWYGQHLSGQVHTRVDFVDLDLTETESRGSVFTECVFRRAKFNCSVHNEAAFVNCTFRSCDFFETQFIECKLVGSNFEGCSFDLMYVEGGNWSHVGLAGADLHRAELADRNLRGSDLSSVEPRAMDLRGAIITIDQALVIAHAPGLDVRAE